MAQIPDKVYYRIGEVSCIVGVAPHVLRYWESEFAVIRPVRGKSRQRLYRRRDVELLLHIKELVHLQGYTIAGAKKIVQFLSPESCRGEIDAVDGKSILHTGVPSERILDHVKQELNALLHFLGRERT